MSSRTSPGRADIDVGLLHDPKVLMLARRQQDPQLTAVTVTLYLAAVLASWREDRPCSVEESAPAWWMLPLGPVLADLHAVGLTDATGRVPKDTLDRWMEPLRLRRAGGTLGAERRWSPERRASGRNSQPQASHRPADANNQPTNQLTNQPTVPSPSIEGDTRGRAPDDPRSLKDILRSMGAEPLLAREVEP